MGGAKMKTVNIEKSINAKSNKSKPILLGVDWQIIRLRKHYYNEKKQKTIRTRRSC